MTLAVNRAGSVPALASFGAKARRWGLAGFRAILVLVNIAGIVALVTTVATEVIDDDLAFVPPAPVEGGLKSVDMAAALIEREVDEHPWVPNEPFFMPGAWTQNMAAYQQGMIYGISRFALELADSVGRTRGATAVDPDLDRASGLLRFPGNVWIFDFEKTWTPVVTSEETYLAAARALQAYNRRVAAGEAVFNPRPDNLHVALQRIETDISSQANLLVDHVELIAEGGDDDISANQIFYETKGKLYAYAMIVRAMGEDFKPVIEREGLSHIWNRMVTSLDHAAALHPFFVTESEPGSLFLPSHTAELGFFTLRAKTQIRDVMAVLREG